MGWFGAKPYQLNKFRKMYNSFCIDKVKILPTPVLQSLTFSGLKQFKVDGPPKEVNEEFDVIHLFSGSCLRYHSYMQNNPNIFNHKKVIFDSGPFFPTSPQVSNYITETIPILKNYKSKIKKITDIIWYIDCNPNTDDETCAFIQSLKCDREKLFLNSQKDQMIDYEKIMATFSNNNEKHVIFENSSHLQHYKKNKKQYEETIKKFLNIQ